MKPCIFESNIGIIILCSDIPSLKCVIEIMRVQPDSYAEEFATRLYWAFWGMAYDMRQDYTNFYNPEYSTFIDYLRKKHALNRKALALIQAHLAVHPNSLVCLISLPSYSDYNILQNFFEDFGFTITTAAKCLGVDIIGGKDEN